MTYLFLDDERFPADDGKSWHIVRSFDEAVSRMTENGCPSYMSFDNDLGGEKEGWHVAQWMIEHDMDMSGGFIPENFEWYVHSQNSVRRDDISARLSRYMKWRADEARIPSGP